MGQKLEGSQLKLYRRTDEILHYLWDPTGIAGEIGARDEYDAYLPKVFMLLNEGASVENICAYLNEVAEVRMGLSRTAASVQQTERIVELLLKWKRHLASSPMAS